MPAKLTKDEINIRLEHRGIQIEGEYINSNTKADFRCQKNHIWTVAPNDVVHGNGCPHCSGKFPLSKELVNSKLESRGITLLGDYINNHKKSNFECDKGHQWATTVNSVLSGCGCPQCAYDYSKESCLYILEIKDHTETAFTGFGITSSVKVRFAEHRGYLKKHNKYIKSHYTFELKNRFDAISVENKLKTLLPIFNSGIPGFITEATKTPFDDVVCLAENLLTEGK